MSTTVASKPRLTTSAMIASIAAEGQRTRPAPFGHALVELARQRPEIVGMTADLAKYTDLHIFAKAYPDRFFQMGMAEQLLMGAAGGMAKEGFIPFVTTYAVFAARRAYDFIHQVIAEENLNVKIVCALPGLTTGYGPSHQATEDIAIFRGMPNLTIIDPCDARRHRAGRAGHGRAQRAGLHASASRAGAGGAGRVRLQVRAGQGQAPARRQGCVDHLQRLHDDARARDRRGASRGRRRRRRAARRPRSSRSTRRRSCGRRPAAAGS